MMFFLEQVLHVICIMKPLLALMMALFLSACGANLAENASKQSVTQFKYSFCGTITRPSGGMTGGSNDVRIVTNGRTYFLLGDDSKIQSEIDAIDYPNDYYLGCAHGNKIGQGYEGDVLFVQKLELKGTI